jgi:hypothetical protein
VVVPKLDALLVDCRGKALVLNELESRHRNNALLHEALTNMVAESKEHAFNETLLWIGVSAIFAMLLAAFVKVVVASTVFIMPLFGIP